jgi:hypothetical protein
LVANAILEIEVWTCLDPAVAYPHPRPFPRAVDPPPGAGWTHTDTIVRSLPVIVEENAAFALLHEDDLEERLHQRVVECPWPPEEDPERLAPMLEQLRAVALRLEEED